jgi:hypothetical protein
MKYSTPQHRGTPRAPILEPLSHLTRRIQDTLYTHYGDAPPSRRPACYNTLRELLLQASWYTTASSQEYHGGTDGYTLTTNIIALIHTLRKPAYRNYLPKLQEYLRFCNPTSSETILHSAPHTLSTGTAVTLSIYLPAGTSPTQAQWRALAAHAEEMQRTASVQRPSTPREIALAHHTRVALIHAAQDRVKGIRYGRR